jgi:hypothetical protein
LTKRAKAALRRKKTASVALHVKLTHPEQRGALSVVADYPTVVDAVVSVRADPVSAVPLAPSGAPVQTWKNHSNPW